MVEQYAVQTYYALLLTLNVTLTLIIVLAACLCCKRKVPKNELLGLEGMVKLKNPDDIVIVTAVGNSESQADLNLSTISTADSEKRASTAAHRSLPDIPVAETNGDNGSELYETVADKRLIDAQNNRDKSPIASLKKQTSVSQHSSISQADDVSSPYSRVKNSPHDYAKVRSTEHPYAQLNAPSTSTAAAAVSGVTGSTSSQLQLNSNNNDLLNRNSHHSSSSTQNLSNTTPTQAEIPAASAIAGMISASQDLPYMTPPISNQHFSGDSQDSSKGYTSISVREPLANILAQQPASKPVQRNKALSRDANDSHYATVSDDSDETYAAIEDPNARHNPHIVTDIYTSGSETYAQIQPMQANSIVVAVEINPIASSYSTAASAVTNIHHQQQIPLLEHSNSHAAPTHSRPTSTDHVVPTPVDSLRAQMQQHSRQASSSSNNSSSMGNLGSPKPEKRQANSPLPPTPTPKTNSTSSSSNLTSGRNSVISVIECGESVALVLAGETSTVAAIETSPQKKNKSLSPSKDIEGMYAKVMKKNKFSRHTSSSSSQNNSPIMARKHSGQGVPPTLLSGISALDTAAAELVGVDKSRVRSNSYSSKDHGYETIPADAIRGSAAVIENRKSDCYANILQKERQQEGAPLPAAHHSTKYTNAIPPIDVATQIVHRNSSNRIDKHYETIANTRSTKQNNDPGYEMLKHSTKYTTTTKSNNSAGLSDDGYAKVIEKKRHNIVDDEDTTDGYSKVRGENEMRTNVAGYSTISEAKSGSVVSANQSSQNPISTDANHNYASILETKSGTTHDTDSDSDYARIAEARFSNLQLVNTTPTGALANDEVYSTRQPEALPTASSPSASINSTSLLHNSSATSTSTNLNSSSLQTPTFSSSQYESLTGSDTDPNYESVCYLNTTTTTTTTTTTPSHTDDQPPYEQLEADSSDTQLNSPLTPDERTQTHPKNLANGPAKALHAADLSTDVVTVDDYFQV